MGIVQDGLIYGIMALGTYISLRILNFPDLTVDGSFPLGMAVSTFCLLRGVNPYLCILISALAGAAAGAVTGFFHVKLKIRDLLSGIITMTALYSINYTSVGKPNEFLDMQAPTIFSIIPKTAPGALYSLRYLIISLAIAVIIKLLLDRYLETKSGFLLRGAGDNERLVVTLAQNPGSVKILGLSLANALVATAGAINLQYTRSFNVSAGTGTLVMGLAAVIIGTSLFARARHVKLTTGVLVGMIIYKGCISLAMQAGLQAKDTNLIVAALFVITLLASRSSKKGGDRIC